MRAAVLPFAAAALLLVSSLSATNVRAEETPTTAAITPPDGVHWRILKRNVNGVHPVATARLGANVALMWLDPSVLKFRLIPGTTAPEKSPAKAIDNRPNTWVPRLVAAFNGGFLLKDNPGGYYYAGKTVKPMVDGVATMRISKAGELSVFVWHKDDVIGKDTAAIRQNWEPLVVKGKSTAKRSDSYYRWGGTDGKHPIANRSALGQRNDGSLVYAFCNMCLGYDLGEALEKADVETAMILDMNKSWPNGFTYTAPKRNGKNPVGYRIHPDQWRQPSEYFFRGTKDIVVATAVKPDPAPEPTPAPAPTQ